ncbi:Gfo/Idh/MocA family protein [Paludibacterium yongneupense]|uniref:Gfo/Idh/MocA family protein n=1 Tax=Paludibacterium yongneupense TaxID=400061 RepID=UPI000418E929|nr:Gfo/Idh/MocA family oxidoreductase [Paludibacterium yongneupense]
MNPLIRWGVLGCARIARLQLAPAILRASNATLVAVASRDASRLDAFGGLFGRFRAHASYAALLEDPNVDAVYIPLPNALHCEWVVRALDAGKHVLCEKPLALNSEQARQMAAAAAANDRLLMEGLMYRYSDRMRQLFRIIDSGVLGELRSINATYRFLLDRKGSIKEQAELGGGALYDIGCYPLDLIGLLTGSEPLSCAVESVVRNSVDVNLSALLRYEGGLIASLHCGFDAFPHMQADIIGMEGRLEVVDTYLDTAGELVLHTRSGRERVDVAASDCYRAEIEDFSAAILEGGRPHISIESSLHTARTLGRLLAQAQA